MRVQTREADTQRLILDWLAARRIWAMRLNTGAFKGEYKGKSRFVRFGKAGMADILAMKSQSGFFCTMGTNTIGGNSTAYEPLKSVTVPLRPIITDIVWIEVKAPKGVQSDAQKEFAKEVTDAGMTYILARSLEDVTKVLG